MQLYVGPTRTASSSSRGRLQKTGLPERAGAFALGGSQADQDVGETVSTPLVAEPATQEARMEMLCCASVQIPVRELENLIHSGPTHSERTQMWALSA